MVEVIGGLRVRITRPSGEVVELNDAEVCGAASVLREAMLSAAPVEVPEPTPTPAEYARTLEEAERDHPVRSDGHPDAYARGLADLVELLGRA